MPVLPTSHSKQLACWTAIAMWTAPEPYKNIARSWIVRSENKTYTLVRFSSPIQKPQTPLQTTERWMKCATSAHRKWNCQKNVTLWYSHMTTLWYFSDCLVWFSSASGFRILKTDRLYVEKCCFHPLWTYPKHSTNFQGSSELGHFFKWSFLLHSTVPNGERWLDTTNLNPTLSLSLLRT